MRPLGNRVLVKRSSSAASKGGIILPDTAKEKPKIGEVVAVGPGKTDELGNVQPLSVSIGDRILFGSYAGTEVKMKDAAADYLILTEDEILGIIV